MIHCIGDSHISVFTGERHIPECGLWEDYGDFRIRHVGAVTAYILPDMSGIVSLCNSVPENEPLLLSFGEIDLRCRVGREADPKGNIDLIIRRYFEFLKIIKNDNIIIKSVTPCLVEKPMASWFEEDKAREEFFTATRGTLEARNNFKTYFNDMLRLSCSSHGYRFLDINQYVKGKADLYMDDIHLDGSKVKEFIKKELI